MNKNFHMPKVAVKDFHEGQFQYLGRWVNKEFFRAFIYNDKGESKLANSYQEFESLTHSGIWYAEKPIASPERKHKYVTLSNSK